MVNHKDIESAMIDVIKVAYSQAKKRAPNEETYNERMADFKDWYNEEIYTSLEILYKLYLKLASQEEKVEKRSKAERSVPAIQQQKLVRSGTTAVRHKNTRQTRRRATSRVSGKLTKKANFAVRSEDEEEYYSDSSSPTSEESEEEDSRRKRVYNSSDQEEIDSENNLPATQKIFRASSKSMVEAMVKECPKPILPEILDYLGKVYNGLKDKLLVNFASKYSSKEKEAKDPDDVATICCKVASMTIPHALIDSGSNDSLISDDIAEDMGLKIDTSNTPRITGVASKANVLGTSYNVPVSISDGINTISVSEKFSIVKAEKNRDGDCKSLVLFGNPLLNKLGWEPIVNREFKATRNGVHVTIPLSVHKSQREVFTAENLDNISVVPSQKAFVNDLELKKN
ncbi:7840_t:CDS:2 [Paraglomus occultum]|uniref:7840_t:CDS:1 n=1 Tax=Paraglomus occultum TaxID=144539 RepID=A0A9N9C4A6_9GLOM|nr:7840_t:CDS:2 [Paraglomus occultum]